MALDLDSIQTLQYPPSEQLQHNWPLQSTPRSVIQRAASFDSTQEDDVQDGPISPGVKRTFSDTNLSVANESSVKESAVTSKDILRRVTLRPPHKSKTLSRRVRKNSTTATPVPRAEGTTFPERSDSLPGGPAKDNTRQNSTSERPVRPTKSRSVSEKIATFARVSWMSTSRSPSPSRSRSKRGASQSREQSPSSRIHHPSINEESPNDQTREDKESAAELNGGSNGKKMSSSKRYRRPLSAFVPRSKSADPFSYSPSLRSKKSLDQLVPPDLELPPIPTQPVPSMVVAAEPRRKKDELWTPFRGLEADLQKFQTKSTNLKVNVVRSSLLTFLSRYASHPSILTLKPEDLDRRVNILNKWWVALLALLHGKNNQSVSGTDRPVYLDALSGIMTRAEWRIPYHPQTSSAHDSNSSLESSSSDFLAESIYHNVRNIFNQNLLSQMSFVVERMSVRHAPLSLVAFCGKACAYAFYFCPGVADMLVRLWNTPAEASRRLLSDPSVYRGTGGRAITQNIASHFPLPVRSLSFSSHIALSRYLRQPPTLPLSAVQIPWQGPWISRWCGRDSDLFFVFVKYFYMLNSDFLPREIEQSCHILAPGMLSVQGQLLVVLEGTLYRQSSPQGPENLFSGGSVTFEDFIEGPNASMSTLPIGMANSHRSMTENRMIILLRDFLSDPSLDLSQARRMYADSFMRVLKTAARKTSLFNHSACFVLCDFVEETAPLVNRYSRKIKEDIFYWPFWMDVCKQLTRSRNSMTEVRLFAFLFSIWKLWTSNTERYRDLCMQFLLHDDYFYTYFSHWNPMVRAYFHRLLCWKVARFNANPTSLDSEVYEMLLDKIEQVWAYYLSFNFQAKQEDRPRLESQPCSPAPGRRILIIRSDNQQGSVNNPFISFDSLTSSSSMLNPGGYQDHGVVKLDPNGLPPETQSQPKRRWNLLRSVFGGSANPKPGEVTPPESISDESEINSGDNPDDAAMASATPSDLQDSTDQTAEEDESIYEDEASHQPFNFKFSLEWHNWSKFTKEKPLTSPSLPRRTLNYVQRQRSAKSLRDSADEISTPVTATAEEIAEESNMGFSQDIRDADTSTTSTRNSYATTKTSVDETDSTIMTALDELKLRDERLVASKYAGRALAEWALVVSEYDNFFERRRKEGVSSDELVETPTLSVENFRK